MTCLSKKVPCYYFAITYDHKIYCSDYLLSEKEMYQKIQEVKESLLRHNKLWINNAVVYTNILFIDIKS